MAEGPSPVSDWAGRLTLIGAEVTYLGLAAYLTWLTWTAKQGTVPGVSGAVAGVAGALAAVFGVGYAALLGVTPAQTEAFAAVAGRGTVRTFFAWLDHVLTLNNLLGAGVFSYMAAGAALGTTYVLNPSESPGIVQTIAVAFGGYVIAYLGLVYKNYRG